MVSPLPEFRPNGSVAGRRPRRAPPLTRQQRVLVSLVAAACGLLFAWTVQGFRHPRHAVVAVDEAGLIGLDRLAVAGRKDGGAAGHTQSAAQAAGGAAATAAARQQQPPKGKESQQLVADAGLKKQAQQKQQKQRQKQEQAQQKQPSQLPGMGDEREWFDKLSGEACARAEQLRVCSHRGRLAVEEVPPGSLGAYAVLHKGGVSCYDVDFVQTRDGQLVASHPQDLLAAVAAAGKAAPPRQLGDWSLAELRAAGADEDRFPTADALIKVFAALLEQSGQLWKAKQGQQAPDYEELPVLLMDLKGEAYNPDTINSVAAAAAAVDAAAHVALFVTQPAQAALVRNQTTWSGPLIRGYLDRQDPSPPLAAAELEPYALLGPSIRMADAFFAAARQLGKPVLAWTVDSPRELHRALEANINAVISNQPLAVRDVLLDWRDRCSERSGRRAQQQEVGEAGGRRLQRSRTARAQASACPGCSG